MRCLKYILLASVLCGFTYGYNNNVQTGKPDLVVKGVTLSDITGFSNYSSGVKSRLDSTFITQTANPNLPNSQAMGTLTTGMVKNTTTTGVQSIGVPSYDYISGYAGLHAQPTIVDNGDGTITVGAADCMLYDNANYNGGAIHYTVAGGTFTPLDGVSSALAIDYNGGSPVMQIQVQGLANFSSNIPIVTMFRSGTSIDFLSWDATAQGLAEKTLERLVRTERFARQSGLALGEVATRTITITSGITWNGVTKIALNAASSATDSTKLWAHVAGVYTPSAITQYDNTQYDDGTNLATLTANRYAVNWIYRQEDLTPEIHVLLGTGDYTINQALAAQPPASLPEVIRTNSILVGRIIVQKSASSAYQIDSAFDVTFAPSPVTSHSDLTNLDYASSGHTGFEPTITAGTSSQFVRGDKSVSALASGDIPNNAANTTGSAATLTTARTINGVSFDGSANIQTATANTSDYSTNTWTPTDASGAGLTLTVTSASYTKIGNMVYVIAAITYPVTADGSNAQLGGLPYASLPSGLGGGTSVYNTAGFQIYLRPNSTSTNNILIKNPSNITPINSQLSGATIIFTFFYFV